MLLTAILAVLVSQPFAGAQGFEQDIAAFEAADAAKPPPPGVILFTGSSSIRGWTGLTSAFPGFTILNRGFGGSRMSDVLYYFDRLVVPPHPSLVVVYEGDNDLAGGVSVATLLGQFAEFLDRMEEALPDTDIAILSVKPSPSRLRWLPETLEVNAALQVLAESRGAYFIDVATPMLNSSGQPRPELFVSDRLHMNAAGYAIWNSITGDFLEHWRATRRRSFLVDFGPAGADTETGPPPADPVRVWNNLTPEVAFEPGGRLESLVPADGGTSPISLVINDPFQAAAAGASLSGWPESAMLDSLTGPASFTLTGLDPARRYQLGFYAGAPDGVPLPQTEYAATGSSAVSVLTDPGTAPAGFVDLPEVRPASDGTIRVSIRSGPDDSGDDGPVRLGVLRIRQSTGELPAAISAQPVSLTVQEFEDAVFTVGGSGSPPLQVQWFRNGTAIPGADGWTLTIPEAARESDGDTFHAVLSNSSSEAVSLPATLTIIPDETPPVLVSALSGDGLTFLLTFSEKVASSSAEQPSFYQINGVEGLVLHAAVGDPPTTVTLQLKERVTGQFSVTAAGITDRAGNSAPAPEPVTGVVRRTFLLDFGGTASLTATDSSGAVWNNVTPEVAATNSGRLDDIASTDGTGSPISLVMVSRFNGVNTAGTTASSLLPSSATQDTFFGNTEEFNGLAGVFPAFRLEGLEPDHRYSLTFYASRTGVADNRETVYTVTGATSGTAVLDASGNVDRTATVSDIAPAGGAITIALAPSPANDSPYHFTYLGALIVETVPSAAPAAPPELLTPVRSGAELLLQWSGAGLLESSTDLESWTPVLPAPSSPHAVDLSGSGRRYFRLRVP